MKVLLSEEVLRNIEISEPLYASQTFDGVLLSKYGISIVEEGKTSVFLNSLVLNFLF